MFSMIQLQRVCRLGVLSMALIVCLFLSTGRVASAQEARFQNSGTVRTQLQLLTAALQQLQIKLTGLPVSLPTPTVAATLASSSALVDPDTFITEAYRMVFAKNPTETVLARQRAIFVDGKMTGNNFVWRLLTSRPTKETSSSTDAEFVDFLYKVLLKRAPDTAGKNGFVMQLSEGIYREEVFRRILYSPESRKTNQSLFATGYLVVQTNQIPGEFIGVNFHASNTTSFTSNDKVLMTPFFFWYKTPGGTGNFTTYPSTYPTFTNPLLSYENVAWYEKELRDIVRAGIDVILPVYWGFPHSDTPTNRWSYALFTPLEQAMKNLEAEGLTMPKVGMFYDTSTQTNNPIKKLDLRLQSDQNYFANTVIGFYSQLAPQRWAQIDAKPIVMLYSASFNLGYNQQVFTQTSNMFAGSFAGKVPYFITEVSWKNVTTDAKVAWGAALNGPTITDKVVEIGPGYNDSNIKTRPVPRIRDRANGDFYRSSWDTAIKQHKNLIVLETWNEYFEGTDISDSYDYGYQYIDLTKEFSTIWKSEGTAVATTTRVIPKDAAAFVTHLYACVLGRAADKPGYDNWLAKTASSTLSKMYGAFFTSQEYLAKKTSDDVFVSQLYRCVLFRAPDETGKQLWVQRLAAEPNRVNLLGAFMLSKEFTTSTGLILSQQVGIRF